ncbi:MAG: HAD family hydrolase [Actinomycetota bacterium]|nr:HAD family hydrolase [Actinomycetota bacterium]
MPRAVLFDMDGTLIDSEHLWLESEHLVMARLGGTWNEADQRECLGGPLERVIEYMLAKVETDVTFSDAMELLLSTMEQLLRTTPLQWQPGARDLIDETLTLDIPTALVTASWRRLIDAVEWAIDHDLGRRAFTVTIGGDEVGNPKPHPEPYQEAARRLGFDPIDCLALEDSPTGTASALAAGCRVIAIPHIALIEANVGVVQIATLEGTTLEALWQLHT